jgi:hypothetical protein
MAQRNYLPEEAEMKKSRIGLLVVAIIVGIFFLGRAFGQREKETEMMAAEGPVAKMVAAALNDGVAEGRAAVIEELRILAWTDNEKGFIEGQELAEVLNEFIEDGLSGGYTIRLWPEENLLFVNIETQDGQRINTALLYCWPVPQSARE